MALAANSKNSGRMISSMRSASLRNKSGDNNKNCSNYHRFKMLGQKKEKVGSVKLMKIEKKNYLRCNKNLKILKDQSCPHFCKRRKSKPNKLELDQSKEMFLLFSTLQSFRRMNQFLSMKNTRTCCSER